MEWVFGAIMVVMLGLYIYSVGWTSRKVTKKVQPFLDNAFNILYDLRKKPRK